MPKSFYKNLVFENGGDVYEPREDSFLLADAVNEHAAGKVLDLGCGSGIQGVSAALKKEVSEVVCADVNEAAVADARKNAEAAGVAGKMRFVESDLFEHVNEQFDCIVFNPPYLPTRDDEKVGGELNAAFDGGTDGRQVTKRFIHEAARFLKPGGIVLLLSSTVADFDATVNELRQKGFEVSFVGCKRLFFEKLVVLKASLK